MDMEKVLFATNFGFEKLKVVTTVGDPDLENWLKIFCLQKAVIAKIKIIIK
jgi:hypothetical protein